MSEPFTIKGQRGELSLYYEDDMVAFDVAEYNKSPRHPDEEDRTRTDGVVSEMFVHYKELPGLIGQLDRMYQGIAQRVRTRAEDAAGWLVNAGVRPQDPARVSASEVKGNPDLMESVALHYLREAADLRRPELPF